MTVPRLSYCSPLVPVKFIGNFWKEREVSRTAREARKSRDPCLALTVTDWPPSHGSNMSPVTQHTRVIQLLLGTLARSHTAHQTAAFVSIKSRVGTWVQRFSTAEQNARSPHTSSCVLASSRTTCKVSHCNSRFRSANADWTTCHSGRGLALDWKTANRVTVPLWYSAPAGKWLLVLPRILFPACIWIWLPALGSNYTFAQWDKVAHTIRLRFHIKRQFITPRYKTHLQFKELIFFVAGFFCGLGFLGCFLVLFFN